MENGRFLTDKEFVARLTALRREAVSLVARIDQLAQDVLDSMGDDAVDSPT